MKGGVLVAALMVMSIAVALELVDVGGRHIYKEGPLCSVTSDTPFSVVAPYNQNISSISFWCNTNLAGMVLRYSSNGSDQIGNISGSPSYTFKIDSQFDFVSQVDTGCFSNAVNQFQLTLDSGLPSQLCGSEGAGSSHTVQIPNRYELVGFFGMQNGQYVSSIGVYLRAIFNDIPPAKSSSAPSSPAPLPTVQTARTPLLNQAKRQPVRMDGWEEDRDFGIAKNFKFGPMCPVLQNAGTMFSVVAPVQNNITYIRLWCQSHIDGLEFTYSNGQTAIIGDTSGDAAQDIDTSEDPVVEVDYTCEGSEMGDFVLVQESGTESAGCGDLSKLRERVGVAQLHTIQIPNGYHLVGMFGQTQTGYPVTIGTYIRAWNS